MTDLLMWNLVVGALLPPVIAVVQQPRWGPAARAALAAVLCVFVGAVTAYLNGQLNDGRAVISGVLVVLVAALGTHRDFWAQLGVTQAIERATSPTTTPGLKPDPTAAD